MQIVVISDNHYNKEIFNVVNLRHPNADLYLHCGDSEMDAEDIRPFVSVIGNNDVDYSMPKNRVIDTKHHSFFITHGHYYGSSLKKMAESAKVQGCDIVLYGHTHIFNDEVVDDIRLINPGSAFYNRDRKPPCYVVLDIDDQTGEIKLTKREVLE